MRKASFIRSGERKVLTASTHPNHCVWRRRRRVMSGAKREQSFFSPAQTFSVSMSGRIEHRFHPYLLSLKDILAKSMFYFSFFPREQGKW